MPLVSFTARELNRGKIVEPAWYRMKIESVGESPSKDGGSTNYPVEGTILFNADTGNKEFAEVPITWNFNSKAMGFAVGFLKSLGMEVEPDTRVDLAIAEGKEIDVFVETDQYQGRPKNQINHKYRLPRG